MKTSVNSDVRVVHIAAENPEAELEKIIAEVSGSELREIILLVDFSLTQYWTDEKNSVGLTALFYLQSKLQSFSIQACVFLSRSIDLNPLTGDKVDIAVWLSVLAVPVFDLNAVIPLQPIAIPKPWGQEIWYTGIERRGVAEAGTRGKKTPLPWLLAIAPQRLGVGAAEPILLKILDPLPEPVFGDLYFELHQQKQEVYVVTAVDKRAWPGGTGAIRFGFDSALRAQYDDDQRFLADYFASVRAYRRVRVQIDNLLDGVRQREDVGLNEPVTAATLQSWLEEVPAALRTEEDALRRAMDRFTRLLPLTVGDVVKVPCLLPHSLQHGVRTVEFQTPVYERLILSFAQKVLTQSEWDTDASAALLQLDPPDAAPFPVCACGEGWIEEQIVVFDNFEVRRIRLQPGARRELLIDREYGLGIVVGATLMLGADSYLPDDGVLLPGRTCLALQNPGASPAYFLLAQPLNTRG
jgi:hypothetical protein